MRRRLWMALTLCILVVGGVVWATTHHTITVDGNLTDFTTDEKTAGDSASDSLYGTNNELSTLYLTWDANKLYLGFDYSAWGTAIMYLVETGAVGGATNMCASSGYTGAFPANVAGPGFDLMVAIYVPASVAPTAAYVYTVTSTGSSDITAKTGVQTSFKNTLDATNTVQKGTVEAAIPWNEIYGLGAGKVPTGAKLKIAGVLRGNNNDDGLGDVSPNPSGSVSNDKCGAGSGTTVDKFFEVTIDANADGTPDPGWSPGPNLPSTDGGLPDKGPGPDYMPAPDHLPPDVKVKADIKPLVDSSTRDQRIPDASLTDSKGTAAETQAADLTADDAQLLDGRTDAGKKKAQQEEGCACSAQGDQPLNTGLLALLALVVLDRRRRGRRAR